MPNRWFSSTVFEADEKFWNACHDAGAEVVVFRNPLKGPHGEPLHCTMAQVGRRDASRHLVVISGTHGVEGYAGAAIQCQALADTARSGLPDGLALTFVHLINPWGCAWERKETEDNVDLHRNFIYTTPPFKRNEAYEEMADFLMLPAWSGPEREAADTRFRAHVAKYTHEVVQRVIANGQHVYPKGIRFNGTAPTWSKLTMDHIVDGWLSVAKQVAVLDIHTGFGKTGEGLVMTYADEQELEYRDLAAWHGSVVQVGGTGQRLAKHPRMPYHYIADRVPGSDVRVVALEFGTDGNAKHDLDLLREDNFIHMHGDPCSPEGRLIRDRIRARFYWERPAWKDAVLARGREVFERTLAGLAGWQRGA
jgi:hypothetical protein